MEAKPHEEWRQQSEGAKARGRALEPTQASARRKSSHHIELLHGSSFFFFFSEGERKKEKGRGLNWALAVDLKVCAGSSGRKSRPFKCD